MADTATEQNAVPPRASRPTPETTHPTASNPPKEDQKPAQGQEKPTGSGAQVGEAGTEEDKKLTPAELKRKAKAEKAARREQTKERRGVAGTNPNTVTVAPAASSETNSKGKGRSQEQQQQQDGTKQTPTQTSAKGVQGQGQGKGAVQGTSAAVTTPASPKNPRAAIPDMFSHLPMARRIPYTQADKDVHPAVLVLGQQMGTFVVRDSISRLEATLHALEKVVQSYQTPRGHTFARHFTPHVLNPQIEYLTACRPMCVAMGNAIRWLKQQVAAIDIDLSDDELKKMLCETLDTFSRERIALADIVIIRRGSDLIRNGDRIVVYSSHPLVERTLLKAAVEDGKRFEVVIVDDPHEPLGKDLARRLSILDAPTVTYCPDLGSTVWALSDASIFLTGVEAMFSNGAMYAAAGTCDVAIAAQAVGTQVVALCESVGVSERLGIDSLSYNEIDPEAHTEDGFRLLFDTTPPAYVTAVITELGITGPTAIPTVLGKPEDL